MFLGGSEVSPFSHAIANQQTSLSMSASHVTRRSKSVSTDTIIECHRDVKVVLLDIMRPKCSIRARAHSLDHLCRTKYDILAA